MQGILFKMNTEGTASLGSSVRDWAFRGGGGGEWVREGMSGTLPLTYWTSVTLNFHIIVNTIIIKIITLIGHN